MTLAFIQGHNCVSNLTRFTCTNISNSTSISAMAFKLGMTVDLCTANLLVLVFHDPWPGYKVILGRQMQKFSAQLSQQLSKQQAFLCDLDFKNVYIATILFFLLIIRLMV